MGYRKSGETFIVESLVLVESVKSRDLHAEKDVS